MPLLTESEFKATADPHAVRVGPEESPPFDFWGCTVADGWSMPALLVNCENENGEDYLAWQQDRQMLRRVNTLIEGLVTELALPGRANTSLSVVSASRRS